MEKVNPDLVARDDQGKPYTVRDEAVNAMLLNEFLKEHRKVEEQALVNQEQEATIKELKSALTQQQKEIRVLAAQIQRVSNQLGATKAAPKIVADNQLSVRSLLFLWVLTDSAKNLVLTLARVIETLPVGVKIENVSS